MQAAKLIREFTRDITFTEYESSMMLRSAVERQFEIIGEALSQALYHFPKLEEEITAGRQIVAFRSRLIHAYASVDPAVVWGVIEEDLPVLRNEVEELL
jgi:uncharacterized protein with HEPN domain